MNVLGIDFGAKQVGLAIWISGVDTISPVKTVKNTKAIVNEIINVIKAYDVHKIVIGWPQLKELQEAIKRFITKLVTSLNDYKIEVVYIIEDYSTRDVVVDARAYGKSWSQIKKMKQIGIIDSLSAVNILERAKSLGKI